jgi:hypothetical protein
VRFVRTTAETVGAWWGFAAEIPLMFRLLVLAAFVLALAGSWRMVRGSR